MNKIKGVVERVLEEDVRARNNDLWLILQVWQKEQQIKLFVPYDKLGEMFNPESITRCRRMIQNNECRFEASDAVKEKRGRRREENRLRGALVVVARWALSGRTLGTQWAVGGRFVWG